MISSSERIRSAGVGPVAMTKISSQPLAACLATSRAFTVAASAARLRASMAARAGEPAFSARKA